MEKTEWFQKAVQAIMDTDEDAAKEVATKSLEAGMDPLEMINQGFTEGIRQMGDLFERGEVFLPGLIVASKALLDKNPDPDEETIRYWLAGNLCRCTGYDKIVRAVQDAATVLQAQR